MAHGDFILITPGVSGKPPLDTELVGCEVEAFGPLFVPPGSSPEPRGHLHSSASASARRSSVSLAIWSKLWEVLQWFCSALVSGKRCSAALASFGEK